MKAMTSRVVEGLPAEQYHSSLGLSSTVLKAYGASAEKGKAQEDGLITIGEKTREFGEQFHAATLEPAHFDLRYIAKPLTYPAPADYAKVKGTKNKPPTMKEGDPLPWNGNAGICEEWEKAQTRNVISADDYAAFKGMGQALQNDERMGPFMRAKGRYELSLFAELDGVPVRARLDKLIDGGPIVDLKSTVSAEPFAFTRQMIKLRYHVQAFWYSRVLELCGIPFNGFVFGAVEKKPPYAVLCCELDDAAFNKGREEGERLFELYRKCHREKKWPGYVSQKIPYQIQYPRWALEMQNPAEQIIYELEEN